MNTLHPKNHAHMVYISLCFVVVWHMYILSTSFTFTALVTGHSHDYLKASETSWKKIIIRLYIFVSKPNQVKAKLHGYVIRNTIYDADFFKFIFCETEHTLAKEYTD